MAASALGPRGAAGSGGRLTPEFPEIGQHPLGDEAATVALGRRLAPLLRGGDVLALWGGPGAGKSVLARALIRARSGRDEDVPSPTFTLVQTYAPAPPIAGEVWHFDLYRLEAPEDAWELGLEEALADGIAVIEWPDRLGPLLPAIRLDLTLSCTVDPGARLVRLSGTGDWPRRLAEAGLA